MAPTTPARAPRRTRHRVATTIAALLVLPLGAAVLVSSPAGAATTTPMQVIGAENQYANVMAQIGGRYVHVASILDNPNTDPHTFEASPQVAQEVARAQLIVQNGVGYDTFMGSIEGASPKPGRQVIVVQHLLGLPDNTPNPHLWYSPSTMPKVAAAVATALARLDPPHSAYFRSNVQAFDASLQPWLRAIAAFKKAHPNTPVATTEPVADDLLSAMGMHNLTPFVFQADIMNGVDPSPQNITLEDHFFSAHLVKVFCYNEQVVDSLTTSIRQTALHDHVPVVAVYETMPTGDDYQQWMMAELRAISSAVTAGKSTPRL
ncbi:MAG TPA: zinc ABC transporter substrate-binding protein [Acidimicrobiales bacterium]